MRSDLRRQIHRFDLVAVVIALISIAAGFRAAYPAWSAIPSLFEKSGKYFEVARLWAIEGAPLDNLRSPLFSLWLGVLMRSFGPERFEYAAVLLQAGLVFAILLGIYFFTKYWTGRSEWALFALLCAAANLAMIREFLSGRETVLFSVLVCSVAFLLCRKSPPSTIAAATAGALVALAWMVRPTGIVLALLAPVFAMRPFPFEIEAGGAAQTPAHETGAPLRLRRTVRLFSLVIGMAIPLFAWVHYQNRHFDSIHISGNVASVNLYKGHHEAFPTLYPWLDVDVVDPQVAAIAAESDELGLTRDHLLQRKAFRYIVSHPVAVLRMIPAKLFAFFAPLQFPLGSGTLEQVNGDWRIVDYQPVPLILHLLTLAALPGVLMFFVGWIAWKKMTVPVRFTLILVALTAALHALTFGETRFRQPFDPLLAASAAMALQRLFSHRAEK